MQAVANLFVDLDDTGLRKRYSQADWNRLIERRPGIGLSLDGVVTLSFSGRKGQGLVDIQAKQAAIFHASKASRRW